MSNKDEQIFGKDLSGIIKSALIVVFGFLILSEIFNFIILRGFENPIAYTLFKIIVYTSSVILLKNSDTTTMICVLAQVKEMQEILMEKLDQLQRIPIRVVEVEEAAVSITTDQTLR
jgi:hypothetical protein